jgi:hypothetical protein
VGIFEPRDWIFFQTNSIFHGVEHMNPSFEKIPFEEGKVHCPIPALSSHLSKIPVVILRDR